RAAARRADPRSTQASERAPGRARGGAAGVRMGLAYSTPDRRAPERCEGARTANIKGGLMADVNGLRIADRKHIGLAEMLKGGVIMDVTNAEQAKIAEDAGAASVMALERVPSDIRKDGGRSEEHTSELQSPDHLVCRLLLEKKK